MAPNPRRIDAAIEALYAELPGIACRGLCAVSCGPAPMTHRERERLEHAAGAPVVAATPEMNCSLLVDGECSMYALRPLICRLWGVVEGMRCPFGCVPVRMLSDVEARELIDRIGVLAGDDGGPLRQFRLAIGLE